MAHLLKCRLNSRDKAGTKTQIPHKNSTYTTQKQNTKQI